MTVSVCVDCVCNGMWCGFRTRTAEIGPREYLQAAWYGVCGDIDLHSIHFDDICARNLQGITWTKRANNWYFPYIDRT